MKKETFKLLMLSAMYENGGNTTHRLLDGHPQLFVYPFESQPGTKFVNDHLSSLFPLKYRWPIFPNTASIPELYRLIIDEEAKVRARMPYVSKFRSADIDMSDEDRLKLFSTYLKDRPLTRGNIMAAFFSATFEAWKNYNKSGKEKVYVGYSPIIGVDGQKIIEDYKGDAFVLHIVRNPFSAYADTKKRPVPLSVEHYMTGWVICQYYARFFAEKYPDNFFILRFEDIIKDPKGVLGSVLKRISLTSSDTLASPSWNGEKLKEVYPWGTIRIPTEDANLKTARELSKQEIIEIFDRTKMFIDLFDYSALYKKIK